MSPVKKKRQVQVDIRVPEKTREELDDLAAQLSLKRSDLIRAGIKMVLEKHWGENYDEADKPTEDN